MSRVIATVAWPSRSLMTLGCTPAWRARVAWVWRRSWRRILGSPARWMRRSNLRRNQSGCSGWPSSRVNTRSPADHAGPSASRSAACWVWWASSGRPRAVLGRETWTMWSTMTSVWRTDRQPPSRSTSAQRSPRTSPRPAAPLGRCRGSGAAARRSRFAARGGGAWVGGVQGGVADQQAPADGVVEGFADGGVDVLDGAGAGAALQQLGVQGVEHGGGELLEVDLPDRRDEVAFGFAAVLGPGAGADLVFGGGEPLLAQVLRRGGGVGWDIGGLLQRAEQFGACLLGGPLGRIARVPLEDALAVGAAAQVEPHGVAVATLHDCCVHVPSSNRGRGRSGEAAVAGGPASSCSRAAWGLRMVRPMRTAGISPRATAS